MIPSLDKFDRIVAAGILARAALALDDETNPAAALALPEEWEVRAEVIATARKAVGIAPGDESPENRERLADYLDVERDRLIGHGNSDEALLRLSAKGELPSDLYDVKIIPNIATFLGRKYPHEQHLIEQTVRSPDREQHYAPTDDPESPFLISLFAKTFADKYSARSFIMLVAGERQGLRLVVHQAWRLYPDKIDLTGAIDLIDMLRRFADVFGVSVEVGDQRGNFILLADIPVGKEVPNKIRVVLPPSKKSREITITYFRPSLRTAANRKAALTVGIDLDRYRDMLKTYGW